ncbi:restriction endonuclease [Campylobacter sp. LR286c]|uniref:restriction endonuclease n=1 Tax=Campylobacter sp. LR286c TaxID=2593545 RepID=UPI001680A1F1|nr:restriction endonuclease [Campylobacter sp. LR286c]
MIYELPLTQITGKIRIKERLTFSDYGLSIAPLKTIVNERHYIEWQIGYDKIATKYNFYFYGANKKPKRLYELSEIIFDFYKNDIIKRKSLENIKSFLENNTELIKDKAQINRSIFKPENIANTQFLQSFISYPLFIYKDKNFLSEIIIKEK